MQLTVQSDIALRILIFLGSCGERTASTAEMSRSYGLSQHHVAKVAHLLCRSGYVSTRRGKAGGFRLALRPEDVDVGKVIRLMEPDFDLLECFNRKTDHCPITRVCRLKSVLHEAKDAFLAVLDRYTLADLLRPRSALRELLIHTA